jgi:formylglycine-generating enzyme required for sulfatase activity
MMSMFREVGRVLAVVMLGACVTGASADTFGSGANQFSIDFVTIAGDARYPGSWPAGSDYTFAGVNGRDYRMGTFEISNDQWYKFQAELGVPVTGDPSGAYDEDPYFTGTNVPTNVVSWYEAAQFVNWLNTSTGHQAAYKFTGTQGTGDYALDTWSPAEAYGGTNLYRHKDAMYYLPTEDEWVKAAYWNGTSLQTWATTDDSVPVAGVDSNFDDARDEPWDVGSGSEELNGTYDMMGNVWEWMESPYGDPIYRTGSSRGVRGGSFRINDDYLASSNRIISNPSGEYFVFGFRVASEVPEPFELGDLNCDGEINFFDIDPFVTALVAPEAYPTVHPGCAIELADINADDEVDFFDIDPFIALLVGDE